MHELSVAQNIVGCVVEVAKANGVLQVKKIFLEIGPLSGVVADSLIFCFPIAAKGTVVDGAELVFDEKPLKVLCQDCQGESHIQDLVIRCLVCGGSRVDIISGKELNIKNIEVE